MEIEQRISEAMGKDAERQAKKRWGASRIGWITPSHGSFRTRINDAGVAVADEGEYEVYGNPVAGSGNGYPHIGTVSVTRVRRREERV